MFELSIDDLKPGNLYLWSPDPKDIRTWVPFFHVSDLNRSVNQPKADTYIMYLNRSVNQPKADTYIMYLGRENTGSHDAYMLLIGDQKYAVYNDDFRYGLKEV